MADCCCLVWRLVVVALTRRGGGGSLTSKGLCIKKWPKNDNSKAHHTNPCHAIPCQPCLALPCLKEASERAGVRGKVLHPKRAAARVMHDWPAAQGPRGAIAGRANSMCHHPRMRRAGAAIARSHRTQWESARGSPPTVHGVPAPSWPGKATTPRTRTSTTGTRAGTTTTMRATAPTRGRSSHPGGNAWEEGQCSPGPLPPPPHAARIQGMHTPPLALKTPRQAGPPAAVAAAAAAHATVAVRVQVVWAPAHGPVRRQARPGEDEGGGGARPPRVAGPLRQEQNRTLMALGIVRGRPYAPPPHWPRWAAEGRSGAWQWQPPPPPLTQKGRRGSTPPPRLEGTRHCLEGTHLTPACVSFSRAVHVAGGDGEGVRELGSSPAPCRPTVHSEHDMQKRLLIRPRQKQKLFCVSHQ